MTSLDSFVVSDIDDERDFDEANELGLTLDPLDFAPSGYPVDEQIFPKMGQSVAKGKAVVDEGEEEEEDTPAQTASGSAATVSVDDDESDQDAAPLVRRSRSTSVAGGSSEVPVRRLDFPEMGGLSLDARPQSAPSGTQRSPEPNASSAKRRKVSSAGRSPLGRPAPEDDRLLRLEQKLEESERERKEMLLRMQEKEAEMKRLQDLRDAEAKEASETAKKNHEQLMMMISAAFAAQNSVQASPAVAVLPSVQPTVQTVVPPVVMTPPASPDVLMQDQSRSLPANPTPAAPMPAYSPSPSPSPPRPQPEDDMPEPPPGSHPA